MARGFETGSDNEKIDELGRRLDDVLDSQISSVGGNENISIDSTRGSRNNASGDSGGVRSNLPVIHQITDVDSSGSSTGIFDKINLISSMIIVDYSTPAVDMELRFIQGTAKDGAKIKITPKVGRTLIIKSGGNVLTSSDITVSDTEFYELVKHSEAETGITGGAYKILLSGSGGGNVPNGTAQFQHLEWSGSAWIAQQALAFGINSATSAQLNIPNNTIGLAWRNATNDGNLELKGTTGGNLDLTRDDNTAIDFTVRSQNAVEVDQTFSVTVGSGSATTADTILDTSTAKLKLAVGGAQRLEIDSTIQTTMTLAAPSGGALADFNVTSTHAVDPDNTISMTIGSGSAGIGQIITSAHIGKLFLDIGGAARWQLDGTVGTDVLQTAFSINPVYELFRDDTTNDTDIIGAFNFSADNSTPAKTIFASIFVEATDVTAGTEDSTLYLSTITAGLLAPKLTLDPNGMILASGSILLDEISLPSNPAVNKGLIYLRDVAGNTTPFFLDSAGTETSMIAGGGGSQTPILQDVVYGGFDIKDISNVEFRNTIGAPGVGNNISADAGGLNLRALASNNSFDFFLGSLVQLSIQEDGVITFPQDGHFIEPQTTALKISSFATTDSVDIWNGTSASNLTMKVENFRTTFTTSQTDTSAYILQLIQNNNTPVDFRTIGNIDFIAENSASVDTIYARISSSSQDITDATEDGLLQLGIVSGGTLISAIDMEGSSSGGANDVKIGFFGETPVVQQSVASDTLANLYTSLRNLGLIV